MDLGKVSTRELVAELVNREGVSSYIIDPHVAVPVHEALEKDNFYGPMIIIEVVD